MFDEWSVIVWCTMISQDWDFFSTIVTLKLFDQPKGGKRRIHVNNLCENIDVLHTRISTYWLWTYILHISFFHCSRICRFPTLYIFWQNLFADNLSRVKTEFAGNTNRRDDNIFPVISFGKHKISHISTLN